MDKKKIATMIVAVVAVAASYNIYQSQNTNTLSDLALANVEALASGEWGGLIVIGLIRAICLVYLGEVAWDALAICK